MKYTKGINIGSWICHREMTLAERKAWLTFENVHRIREYCFDHILEDAFSVFREFNISWSYWCNENGDDMVGILEKSGRKRSPMKIMKKSVSSEKGRHISPLPDN